jgi:hypothetical protein
MDGEESVGDSRIGPGTERLMLVSMRKTRSLLANQHSLSKVVLASARCGFPKIEALIAVDPFEAKFSRSWNTIRRCEVSPLWG